MPAVVENDASLGMLGEHAFGAARGAMTALYLTVSTAPPLVLLHLEAHQVQDSVWFIDYMHA